jgi:hypothetical protein
VPHRPPSGGSLRLPAAGLSRGLQDRTGHEKTSEKQRNAFHAYPPNHSIVSPDYKGSIGRAKTKSDKAVPSALYFAEQISSFSRGPFAASSARRSSGTMAEPFNPAGTNSTISSFAGSFPRLMAQMSTSPGS